MRLRACPLCGSTDHETLLELEANDFCRTNWSYSPDFRAILGLPPRAMFPIARCRGCHMQFAALLPEDAFLTALYDRVIQRVECIAGSENRPSYARRLRYVAELIELAPPADPLRALDYGSGLGVTLRILGTCRIEATGYDPSAMRSEYVQDRDLTVVGNPHSLRGPFGIIVLDNVLEHLPDPAATMEMLREVSTPEAIAYVSVPPYEERFMQAQIERHGRGAAVDMTLNPWEHLNYFSLKHLDALLATGGFRRLRASERLHAPTIGLRAERTPFTRIRNVSASLLRLAGYALWGDAMASAEHVFYRRVS